MNMDLLLEDKRTKINSAEENMRSAFSRAPDPLVAFEALGRRHEIKAQSKKVSSINYRKHHGIYYTPYVIAKKLIDDLLNLGGKVSVNSTFLDPCAGHGIFIVAYIDAVAERLSLKTGEEFQQLIDHVYYADRDKEAIELLRISVPAYIKAKYNILVALKKPNSYIGNTLFTVTENGLHKNDLKKVFNQADGFSIVATNPPYKLLKVTRKHYDDELSKKYRANIKELVNFLRKGNYYPLSEGTLNLYKLFCEEILSNLSTRSGKIGLLVPQTLLNDKQSTSLRKTILQNKTGPISIIPESSNFFPDISQAFCFFGFQKQAQSTTLSIVPSVCKVADLNKPGVQVEKKLLQTISNNSPLIALDEKGWQILKKIHTFPTLKDIPQLRNLRGELDLTLNRSMITANSTPWPLLRGSNLKFFSHTQNSDFVLEKFVSTSSKGKYVNAARIACQQISNINSKKRLKFSLIEPGVVLGNSCNFITLDNESIWKSDEISLKYLLGVLNSNILEWRFNLTSSNNHVGNHELGDLPLPLPTKTQQTTIEKLVNLTLEDKSDFNLSMLNAYVARLYRLNSEEFDYIQKQTIDKENQGGLL
jgi:Alw26I/Eco31I/Esp3I family type II restriction m6 adenine DNA methyltransferase